MVGRQVLAPEIEEIELLFEDGERVKVPFVWVSPPIDPVSSHTKSRRSDVFRAGLRQRSSVSIATATRSPSSV